MPVPHRRSEGNPVKKITESEAANLIFCKIESLAAVTTGLGNLGSA
jgi:hypothetical protein